jgi:hypothetical protein
MCGQVCIVMDRKLFLQESSELDFQREVRRESGRMLRMAVLYLGLRWTSHFRV